MSIQKNSLPIKVERHDTKIIHVVECLTEEAIEKFVISDPVFFGFDGSDPLLAALDKEINLALEIKGQICHKDFPKCRYVRIDR